MSSNHLMYEKLSKLYEGIWYPMFQKSFRKVCGHINSNNPKNVLEVGIGPGSTLKFYDPSIHLTGVDVSKQMIEIAQKKVDKKNLENVTLLATEPDNYPFEKKSFDIAVTFSVVTVVPEPIPFVESIVSMIKPGGLLYIVGHFQKSDTNELLKTIDELFDPVTKKLMGFTMKLKEEELKKIKNIKLVEKFTATDMLNFPFNSCLVFKVK